MDAGFEWNPRSIGREHRGSKGEAQEVSLASVIALVTSLEMVVFR